MLKRGQLVRIEYTIMHEETSIDISMEAMVLAVGAKESFLLLKDIDTGKLKNMYLENSRLSPIEEDYSLTEEVFQSYISM